MSADTVRFQAQSGPSTSNLQEVCIPLLSHSSSRILVFHFIRYLQTIYNETYIIAFLLSYLPAFALGGHLTVLWSDCNPSYVYSARSSLECRNYLPGRDSLRLLLLQPTRLQVSLLPAASQLMRRALFKLFKAIFLEEIGGS
jgi:hypothetical protein